MLAHERAGFQIGFAQIVIDGVVQPKVGCRTVLKGTLYKVNQQRHDPLSKAHHAFDHLNASVGVRGVSTSTLTLSAVLSFSIWVMHFVERDILQLSLIVHSPL